MASDRLNDDEVDDVLNGRRPAGREVPEAVEHVVAVLHASRELEPAPPMSDELRAEVYGFRPPAHVAGAPAELAGPADISSTVVVRAGKARSARRAVASMAAAAAFLVGVVLAATLPEGKAGRSDLGETPTGDPASPAVTAPPPTTVAPTGDIAEPAPAETVDPPATEAAPPPAAEEPTPSTEATAVPEAPAPGDDGYDRRGGGDRDRDGDRDWRDGDRYRGDGDRDFTTEQPTSELAPSTAAPTTSTTQPQESSTTSTTRPEAGDTTTTTSPPGWDDWWWGRVYGFDGQQQPPPGQPRP